MKKRKTIENLLQDRGVKVVQHYDHKNILEAYNDIKCVIYSG